MSSNPLDDSLLQPAPITEAQARRAALFVCGQSTDSNDARWLLRLLGLIPDEEEVA